MSKESGDETIKVTMRDPEAFERCRNRKGAPDFTVTYAKLGSAWCNAESSSMGFIVEWGTVSAGFGEVSFFVDGDGKLTIDNEAMSMRFVKEVLAKFVDSAVAVADDEVLPQRDHEQSPDRGEGPEEK